MQPLAIEAIESCTAVMMTTRQRTFDIAAAYDRWAETYDTDPNRTRELAAEVLRGSSGRDVIDARRPVPARVWKAKRALTVVSGQLV
ncbi:MAG TPA: hypothetical protein VNL14_20470 [Candidatus Acidoferrales bacterium]|nr:hypothetical protein [Candidatus Acidoferrales bacterium]